MRKTLAPLLITLVALPLTTLPLDAQEGRPPLRGDDGPNVQFTLTLLDTDSSGNAQERRLETLATAGRAARIRTGWKIAIPVTASGGSADAQAAYQYQDVGLSFTIEGSPLEGDRIRVSGRIELSSLEAMRSSATAAATGMPQIGVYSQQFEVTLAERTATTLAEVPKPEGGATKLVLTASSRL